MGDDWCDAGRDWDGVGYEPPDNIGPSLEEQRRQQQQQALAQQQQQYKDSYQAAQQKQKAEPLKPAPPKGR